MYNKAALLTSIRHETKVIKHLATQVPAGQLDYRPTPGQRSTIELMRYLTIAARGSARFACEQSWEWWDALEAEAKQVEPATFAKAMDRQLSAITKLLKPFTDAKLAKKATKTWSGQKLTLGEAMVEMVLKTLTAYRMQLFLYAKASGASQLGTSDCWHGKAAKAKKAKAATA
jgi:hypothetical protein